MEGVIIIRNFTSKTSTHTIQMFANSMDQIQIDTLKLINFQSI